MIKLLGWREWLSLPEIGIPGIKAKIDTGARTSALHAYFVEPYLEGAVEMVRFGVHPIQKRNDIALICKSPILEKRLVADSGGHQEERYVIETLMQLGPLQKRIEMTLTNRDTMKFRMLLGRQALQQLDLPIDAGKSYLVGKSLLSAYAKGSTQEQIQ